MIAHANVSLEHLQTLNAIFDTMQGMHIEPNIWQSQNLYFSMMQGYKKGEWVFSSDDWKEAFYQLGENLQVNVL